LFILYVRIKIATKSMHNHRTDPNYSSLRRPGNYPVNANKSDIEDLNIKTEDA